MIERRFTRRLEANLERGLASVPLPAAAPASARYRISAPRVARRRVPRLGVAIAGIGLALVISLAAASGTRPTELMSVAVNSIQVLVEKITRPASGNPAPPKALRKAAPGPEPATMGQAQDPVMAAGRLESSSDSPSPTSSLSRSDDSLDDGSRTLSPSPPESPPESPPQSPPESPPQSPPES
jgi:hypothetical protein